MDKVKLFHILQVEPIQNIRCLASDSALIVISENPVSFIQCTLGPSVLSDQLFALNGFDLKLLKHGNDKLSNIVTPEIPHICNTVCSEHSGISTKVYTVPSRIHHVGMLINVYYVIAKP